MGRKPHTVQESYVEAFVEVGSRLLEQRDPADVVLSGVKNARESHGAPTGGPDIPVGDTNPHVQGQDQHTRVQHEAVLQELGGPTLQQELDRGYVGSAKAAPSITYTVQLKQTVATLERWLERAQDKYGVQVLSVTPGVSSANAEVKVLGDRDKADRMMTRMTGYRLGTVINTVEESDMSSEGIQETKWLDEPPVAEVAARLQKIEGQTLDVDIQDYGSIDDDVGDILTSAIVTVGEAINVDPSLLDSPKVRSVRGTVNTTLRYYDGVKEHDIADMEIVIEEFDPGRGPYTPETGWPHTMAYVEITNVRNIREQSARFVKVKIGESTDLADARSRVSRARAEGASVIIEVTHPAMTRVAESFKARNVKVTRTFTEALPGTPGQRDFINAQEEIVKAARKSIQEAKLDTSDPWLSMAASMLKQSPSIKAPRVVKDGISFVAGKTPFLLTLVPSRKAGYLLVNARAKRQPAPSATGVVDQLWDLVQARSRRAFAEPGNLVQHVSRAVEAGMRNPNVGKYSGEMGATDDEEFFSRDTRRAKSKRMYNQESIQEAEDRRLWMRVGDGGEYHYHDGIDEAAEHLAELLSWSVQSGDWDVRNVIQSVAWVDLGLTMADMTGHNYVSLYWGDNDAQPERGLRRKEQAEFVKALRSSLDAYTG